MPKPGGCHSSGISLGDVLRLPKRHPAWRRREAQSGSRKKLTCSGHATNSGRYRDFHSLRVGNAGGRLVRNVRTWPAMPREKAQAAPTARPKVLMRRRGADCPVVVRHRLCRPTANETLIPLPRRRHRGRSSIGASSPRSSWTRGSWSTPDCRHGLSLAPEHAL